MSSRCQSTSSETKISMTSNIFLNLGDNFGTQCYIYLCISNSQISSMHLGTEEKGIVIFVNFAVT